MFYGPQPPSPPLETPELVQRSLPNVREPLLPPPNPPIDTQELSQETVSASDTCAPSGSRLCPRSRDEEGTTPSKRQCRRFVAKHNSVVGNVTPRPGSCKSSENFQAAVLMTPGTPSSTWSTSATSSSVYSPLGPGDLMEDAPDMLFEDDLMDWNGDSSHCGSSSITSSPKPRSLSLDLPKFDGFGPSSSTGWPPRSYTDPDSSWPLAPLWEPMQTGDFMTEPLSPHPSPLNLPGTDLESDEYLEQPMSFYDPPPPSIPSSPSRRQLQSLPSLYDDLSIAPHSPRTFTTRLPELEMEDPDRPHVSLDFGASELFTGETNPFVSPPTISPSLLEPGRSDPEGLGLFIHPSSIDPPLDRSPSPDDDDLQFLDIQLDPTFTHLPLDEFLRLRALRRRALDAEREARSLETNLAERVSYASNALLPSERLVDPIEKRARKNELHVATEMRAEARKERKREKQRSKELGALLDLKMEKCSLQGRGAMQSMAQLVANMLLRRRDTFRLLAQRKTASSGRSSGFSPLRVSVSAEDLLADDFDQ